MRPENYPIVSDLNPARTEIVIMSDKVLDPSNEVVLPSLIPSYPVLGDEFDLVIINPSTGLEVIRHFKLVNVGYQKNWQSLQNALAPHGAATGEPERAAFKKKFPQVDSNGPIGFAKIPHGFAYFPYAGTDGDLGFGWTCFGFLARLRWLVEV